MSQNFTGQQKQLHVQFRQQLVQSPQPYSNNFQTAPNTKGSFPQIQTWKQDSGSITRLQFIKRGASGIETQQNKTASNLKKLLQLKNEPSDDLLNNSLSGSKKINNIVQYFSTKRNPNFNKTTTNFNTQQQKVFQIRNQSQENNTNLERSGVHHAMTLSKERIMASSHQNQHHLQDKSDLKILKKNELNIFRNQSLQKSPAKQPRLLNIEEYQSQLTLSDEKQQQKFVMPFPKSQKVGYHTAEKPPQYIDHNQIFRRKAEIKDKQNIKFLKQEGLLPGSDNTIKHQIFSTEEGLKMMNGNNYSSILQKEQHQQQQQMQQSQTRFKEKSIISQNPLIQHVLKTHFKDRDSVWVQERLVEFQNNETNNSFHRIRRSNTCQKTISNDQEETEYNQSKNAQGDAELLLSQDCQANLFNTKSGQKSIITKRNLQQYFDQQKDIANQSLNNSLQRMRKIDAQDSMKFKDTIETLNTQRSQEVSEEVLRYCQNQQSKHLYSWIYKEFSKNYQESIKKGAYRNKKLLQLQGVTVVQCDRQQNTPGINGRKSSIPMNERGQQAQSTLEQFDKNHLIGSKDGNFNISENPKIFGVKAKKQRVDNDLVVPEFVSTIEINNLFRSINRFIQQAIKVKELTQQQLKEIKSSARYFGMNFSNNEVTPNFIKSKEFVSLAKSKIFTLMNRYLLQRNQLEVSSYVKKQNTYKFWIEQSGNNHQLVKQIIRKRSWLMIHNEYTPQDQINYKGQFSDPDEDQNGYCLKIPHLIWTQMRKAKLIKALQNDQIYNHLDGINCIVSKSGLYETLKEYMDKRQMNVFDAVPETYLIHIDSKTQEDLQKKEKDIEQFKQNYGNHIWIVKPGENSNRGHGIQILNSLDKILHTINNEYAGSYKTVVLQKYITNPYLISRRKFDLRVFGLLTYFNEAKKIRGYFYEEGYIRTSCKEFTLKKIDNKYIHLTNDAVQKYSQDYGKYENGNKVSYEDFQKLLMKERQIDFMEQILPQIKERIRQVFDACGDKVVGEIRTDYNGFELMGFDFMIDTDMKLQLIECNTNPCLETQQSILLQRIIPQLLDQTFKIAVDPFLRANEQQYISNPEISINEIKYEMIYEKQL